LVLHPHLKKILVHLLDVSLHHESCYSMHLNNASL